jgi:hypothetical protein
MRGDNMKSKILFKLPSRTRPNRVFEVLDATVNNLGDRENYQFLLTLDEDDLTMNNDTIKKHLDSYKNMNYIFGNSTSKIHAVNRDLDEFNKDWDILVLLSDDMVPVYLGFDDVIRDKFNQYFPDYDGVTWFNDGFQKNRINTLCILGKKYYERFGYIYNPEYKSLYCDNEFTEVANRLKKQVYFENVIIEHRHFSIGNNSGRYDQLYMRNDSLMKNDELVFWNRRNKNFDLVLV